MQWDRRRHRASLNQELISQTWTKILMMHYSMVAETQDLNHKLQSGKINWPHNVLNCQSNQRGDKSRFNQKNFSHGMGMGKEIS